MRSVAEVGRLNVTVVRPESAGRLAALAGALGLGVLAFADSVLGLANVAALPSVVGELALLPVDVAAIYATAELIDFTMRATHTTCSDLDFNIIPFVGGS